MSASVARSISEPLTAPRVNPSAQQSASSSKVPRILAVMGVILAGSFLPIFIFRSLYVTVPKEDRSWFVYHPLLMSIGAMAVPMTAVLQMRLFGYTSAKIHMYMQLAGIAAIVGGAYVIITHKLGKGESHFATVHAVMGLIQIVTVLTLASAGLVALDPDNRLKYFSPSEGISNVHRFITVRRLHTWTGRVALVTGCLGVYLGSINFFGPSNDMLRWGTITSVLVGLAVTAVVDPIRDFVKYKKGIGESPIPTTRRGA